MTPDELRAWRVAHNLFQDDLAGLLFVHEMTYSQWERGTHRVPGMAVLALEALDARLRESSVVAATTELLAAAKAACDVLSDDDSYNPVVGQLADAIEKVERVSRRNH